MNQLKFFQDYLNIFEKFLKYYQVELLKIIMFDDLLEHNLKFPLFEE